MSVEVEDLVRDIGKMSAPEQLRLAATVAELGAIEIAVEIAKVAVLQMRVHSDGSVARSHAGGAL